MDIVTLTLNPCLDRTIWVDDFGDLPAREEWQTGGKGVNVARVLAALGIPALAVCPLGGAAGERFLRLAKMEGVDVRPVPVRSETRTIDTWARLRDFEQQVDYRRGDEMTGAELDLLENALFEALPGAKMLVVSGSAPDARAARRVPGILRRAKEMGVFTALDSNGIALSEGVRGMPDLLKPNEGELMSLTGSSEPASANKLGLGAVLLSLGATGCCLVKDGMEKYCPAPKVRAVNPVGSGDSFTAGFLYSILKGYSDERAMMIACAAGAANAAAFPAARTTRAEIEILLGQSI